MGCGHITYGTMNIYGSHTQKRDLTQRCNLLISEATGVNEVREELRSELQRPTFKRQARRIICV